MADQVEDEDLSLPGRLAVELLAEFYPLAEYRGTAVCG